MMPNSIYQASKPVEAQQKYSSKLHAADHRTSFVNLLSRGTRKIGVRLAVHIHAR